MRTTMKLLVVIAGLLVVISGSVIAQDRPQYLTVTKLHRNLENKDITMDDWKALEKEYFDKVTAKNELIVGGTVLVHYFTADNTEILVVNAYKTWEDIEKASLRSDELAKAAWPDEKDREAFMKKQNSFYTHEHSDEIYATLEGAKMPSEKSTKPMVYYIRISDRSFPEDGKTEEIQAMQKEYFDNVIAKNQYIKAYYPERHAWGSDGRDLVEVFVVESLSNLELSMEENQKLVKAHWPDEKKADEFFDKMDKYETGFHADYIYRHVPELSK